MGQGVTASQSCARTDASSTPFSSYCPHSRPIPNSALLLTANSIGISESLVDDKVDLLRR